VTTAEYRAGGRGCWRGWGYPSTLRCAFRNCPSWRDLRARSRAIPDLTIILNHLGGLNRIGPYGNRDDEVLPA
jgi:hypothetical protein